MMKTVEFIGKNSSYSFGQTKFDKKNRVKTLDDKVASILLKDTANFRVLADNIIDGLDDKDEDEDEDDEDDLDLYDDDDCDYKQSTETSSIEVATEPNGETSFVEVPIEPNAEIPSVEATNDKKSKGTKK